MKKEKLYRKENKKSLSSLYHVYKGGEFRWKRAKIKRDLDYPMTDSMRSKNLGRDYTPLYRFLISKVGCNWDEVYSEAVSRLDTPEPIWHIVDNNDPHLNRYMDKKVARVGESTYYPRLYVDDNKILQFVEKNR